MNFTYRNFNKNICGFFICCFVACNLLFAIAPVHAVLIEKTAESGTVAKVSAMTQARRTSFADALSARTTSVDAKKMAAEISADQLNSLIESVAIEDEKLDTTSYSADINVNFNEAALDEWLKTKGVATDNSAETFVAGRAPVFLEPVGISGLGAIMRASRETGADLKITSIEGGRVSGHVRDGAYQPFLGAVRAAGVAVSY